MPYYPYLYELSPLYLVQAGVTVWMLMDAHRRGVDFYWFWIILAFQPIGPWAYFALYKAKDLRGGHGWLAGLFHRRPSLAELRYRVEQSPTVAARLELGERLAEKGAYAEALPHLEAVLAREPDHGKALFTAAQCHRGLGRPEKAVPLLQKLVAHQPAWGNYEARHALIDTCHEAGDLAGAVANCRDLARVVPGLENRCLLAEHLLAAGEQAEARKLLEQSLEEYQYASGPERRRDRRWVGRAKQLLKETEPA